MFLSCLSFIFRNLSIFVVIFFIFIFLKKYLPIFSMDNFFFWYIFGFFIFKKKKKNLLPSLNYKRQNTIQRMSNWKHMCQNVILLFCNFFFCCCFMLCCVVRKPRGWMKPQNKIMFNKKKDKLFSCWYVIWCQ